MVNDSHFVLTTSNSPAGNGVHSVPTYVVGTGTITNTSGDRTVVGVGTTFTTEVEAGDWLIVTGKQARRVASVTNDTLLWLDEGFVSGSGAGVALLIAPYSIYNTITAFTDTGSSGTIDGVTFQAANTYEFAGNPCADPKTIVVAGGNVEVTVSNAK